MSELRSLIRELLAEELAALRAEIQGQSATERVAVGDEAELTDFARQVVRRSRVEPDFLERLETGQIRFAPAEVPPSPAARTAEVAPQSTLAALPVVSSSVPTVPELQKGLITERDIAAIAHGETRLRISKKARMTPLAADEARRRGIRIERTAT